MKVLLERRRGADHRAAPGSSPSVSHALIRETLYQLGPETRPSPSKIAEALHRLHPDEARLAHCRSWPTLLRGCAGG